MSTQSAEPRESVQQVETLTCDRCRKRWEVAWMEGQEGKSVEYPLACDCGRALKVVQTAEDGSPLMLQQYAYGKTLAACLPAFAAGALFPLLSDPVILTAYVLSWIACAATFVNEDNRSVSALGGIAIWSIALVTGAAAVGALVAHALWWWWQ